MGKMTESEIIADMGALVVAFLQQSLKDYPNGYSLSHFERKFPEASEEPYDWYKRYDKNSALEALRFIPDHVKLSDYHGQIHVSLNRKSDKIDDHLVDLIVHQKTTKRKLPSNRALKSFELNRMNKQYNIPQFNSYRSNRNVRLNQDQRYRNDFSRRAEPSFRSNDYRAASLATQSSSSSASAFSDPRKRASGGPAVSPQMKPPSLYSKTYNTSSTSSPTASRRQPQQPQQQQSKPTSPPASSSINQANLSLPISKVFSRPSSVPQQQEAREENTELLQKKSHLRQRLVSLLTHKYAEIKLFHLCALYKIEYEEELTPANYGHTSITNLIQDPLISEYINIKYGSPFVKISARSRSPLSGKENVIASDARNESNSSRKPRDQNSSIRKYTSGECIAIQSQVLSAQQQKLDAVDPFNTRTMLENLEPLGDICVEPPSSPLKNMDIENIIKYKTIRIIYKEPESSLKVNDWPVKYEQESRLRLRIRDYGFTSILDFFQKLSVELPIKLSQNDSKEWIASIDFPKMSQWIKTELEAGKWKAVTAIESRYELIACPGDTFTYIEPEDLEKENQEFMPAYILSVKPTNYMWIQLRTPKRIEAHLCVETSMASYRDYQATGLLRVPHATFLRPGFPCAVFDKIQQRWCRALIISAPKTIDKNYEITALLVDYGQIRNYPASDLVCLMKSHLKLPANPIYARLDGVLEQNYMQLKLRLLGYTCPPVALACKFVRSIPIEEPHYPKNYFEVRLIDTRLETDVDLTDICNSNEKEEE